MKSASRTLSRKPPKWRVVLADDHQLVLEGLVRLLDEHCHIVGTTTDAASLLSAVALHHPDIVLTDLAMPKGGGLHALRQLTRQNATCRVIVVTMHADPELARQALQAGAQGYVLKQAAGEELVEAIRVVAAGGVYVTRSIAEAHALTAGGAGRVGEPSARQRDVLRLLAQGLRTKEIAAQLDLSPRTVESHKREMMRALHLDSTAKLIRYAILHNLDS